MNSFTIVIKSSDKISGTNNNFNVMVPFTSMQPNYKKLKIRSSWQTLAGDYQNVGTYYKSNCEVRLVLPSNRSTSSYDTSDRNTNYLSLGIASQSGATTSIRYYYDIGNSFEHIIDYPTTDYFQVQVKAVYPQSSGTTFHVLSNGTASDQTDMGSHYLYLECTGLN
jgi:hypothetical protein